jgi:hypothetical protein
VIVAGALIVAALFALGILRWGPATPASPYLTFSGAQSTAQGAAGSVSGGPWYASLGISLLTRTSFLEPTENVSGLLNDANCTYDWPHGEPANLEIAQTPASVAGGASAYWMVALKNASNGLLLETISDGSAQALVTMRGSECSKVASYLVQFPPGTVDSPSVISAVNAAGGSKFLLAHPNATELWGVIGGISLGPLGATNPEWYVGYTSCTFPAIAGASGAYFNATVGGLSGDVIGNETGTTACTLGLPVPSALAPGPLSPVAAGKAI